MLLVEHDQVVQAFSAERPDDSFNDNVCRWRVNRRHDAVDTDPTGSLTEVAAVHRVSIME